MSRIQTSIDPSFIQKGVPVKAVDVMGFAGSMAAGIDQAGFDVIAKREPSAFHGFGVSSLTYNMPWVEAQVADAADWDLPAEDVELVYGCPPCSGFSQLSSLNTKIYAHTGTTYRGEGAEINECMRWLMEYAADVKPRVVIMESVGPAFKIGRYWMESLWELLKERSGLPYQLTHVNMNAAWVGGDVVRPRYFFVAHLDPFGVGLDFVEPRSVMDVIGDLGDVEPGDADWGQVNRPGQNATRVRQTIEWLHTLGRDWVPGTRLPQNTEGLEPPDFWLKAKPHQSKRAGYRPDVYSHWYSEDPFSPHRWKPDKPFGVIVAASLDRAIHPTQPRPLTYREAARLMSLPDTWSMRVLVEQNRADELGKAVPSASAKWIGHWAKMSIEGTPGEYAGRLEGEVHVIDVQTRKQIDAVLQSPGMFDEFYAAGTYADPDPETWLIDRKARPREWWQRSDELGLFAAHAPAPRVVKAPREVSGATKTRVPAESARSIVRVQPAEVAAFLAQVGLTSAQAAEKLGVSVSRIHELTSDTRPASWLNAERWSDVQEVLRG